MAGCLRRAAMMLVLVVGCVPGARAQYGYPYGYPVAPQYPFVPAYPFHGYGAEAYPPAEPYPFYDAVPQRRRQATAVRPRPVVQRPVMQRPALRRRVARPAVRAAPQPGPVAASLPTPFEAAGRDGGAAPVLSPAAGAPAEAPRGPVPALPAPRAEVARPGGLAP